MEQDDEILTEEEKEETDEMNITDENSSENEKPGKLEKFNFEKYILSKGTVKSGPILAFTELFAPQTEQFFDLILRK